jgi:hypothetical protein
MKPILKVISFTIFLLFVSIFNSKAQGVFFSEYIEGSSNNKAIEIYNGTAATIDLSNYRIAQGNNGNALGSGNGTITEPYEITLTGSLAAGEVYVIANGSASASITAEADLLLSFGDNPGDRVASFNGDDVMGLYENDVLIDVFGESGVDPGSSWPVAGDGATANYTLVRKGTITSGNMTNLGSFGTNADDSEWVVYPQDDFTYIGYHVQEGPKGVFFSEYIEGASNNKAIEIFNGTDATIDLSIYKVVQGNNGNPLGSGNGTITEPYEITLSGSLAAGEVYVIANGSASASITAEADNPGDRVASFNGDDVMGLYENDVLIDVFGESGVDPGSSWPVAGDGATANYTLVRKGTISIGNTTSLGSFGTNASDSEWIVYPQDDFTYIGYHTLDGQTNPLILTVIDGFVGNFGLVEFPGTSAAASYKVSGADLSADLTITPPAGFEISLLSDFSGTIFTSSSPLTISQTGGAISETDIYVRLKPTAADGATYAGDITHSSTGADDKTVSISGAEGVLTNDLFISQYIEGSASNKVVEIFNNSGADADLSLYKLVIYSNGATSSTGSLSLSEITATLASGAVITVANSSSSIPEILTIATISSSSALNFNGDDALAITKNDIIIDVFGQIGSDPGSSWEVGGAGAGLTANQTLVRKSTIQIGNVVGLGSFGTTPEDAEWDILAIDDITGLGTHAIINEGDPVITIDKTDFVASFGQVITNATSVSSNYLISAINLTADITVTAPTDFALSIDGTTYASTLTIPHVDGGVAATTIHVTFTPTTVGSFSDVINHESGDAISQTVTVSGVGLDPSTIIFEDFTDCIDLNTFTSYSVTGDEVWECSTSGETGSGTRISGFAGGAQNNEDWLVSSAIDLSSLDATAILTFVTDVRFDGPPLEVFASTDFTSDVTSATWDKLDALMDTDPDNYDTWTNSGDIFLDDYLGGNVYIGFKYTSETVLGAAQWSIDNFTVNASPFRPFFKVNFSGFNGDFGLTNVGTTSQATSFAIEGNLLTDDVTITPPSQFEVSTSTDFTTQGTAATPLVITPAEGAVDVTVYVRYVPAAEGEASGNIIVSTTGYDAETAEVNGSGKIVLSLDSDLTFSVYPNPVMNQLQVSTTGDDFEGMILDLSGVLVKSFNTNKLDVSTLKAGIYILRIKDLTGAMIHQQRIIKY